MTEEVTPVKTPEWLLLLEKKKNRPHRLAHEIGAGAPCLLCGDKCPGLDLHFWRKLCRNCKCKKEDHDVKDDDGYEQFEILLGAGGKRKKPGAVLKIKVPSDNDAVRTISNRPNKSVGLPFDWIPPNVSEDVAAQYMEQLPPAKIPISGSDGALYRKQQLERQMPLHDLDASRCHNLTPHEIEELQKYLDNLKNNVVGQGRVTKVPTLYTEERQFYHGPITEQNCSHQVPLLPSSRSEQSLRSMPPLPSLYNATPRPFHPRPDDDDVPPPLPTSLPPDEIKPNLKTPGSFVPSKTFHNDPTYVPSQQFNSTDTISKELYTTMTNSTLEGYNLLSNVAYSTSVSGQLASDFSQLQLTRNATGLNQGNDRPLLQDGTKSQIQFSSNIIHSSEGTGQLTPTTSEILRNKHNNPGYPDGSSSTSGLAQNSTNSELAVNNGSTIYSHHPQNIASSTSVGQAGPGMSQLHQGTNPNLYPNDGSMMHAHHPQNIASSTSVGQAGPGMSQLHQGTNPNLYSNDGSMMHSHHPQNIASSTSIGQAGPGMSQLYQGTNPNLYPNDGSTMHAHHPQNIASSTSVGQAGPGMSQLHQGTNPNLYPNDGSMMHAHHPQNIASSTSVGQAGPGMSQQHQGTNPNLYPNDGSMMHSHHPQNIASSTSVAGQMAPGTSHLQQGRDSTVYPTIGTNQVHSNPIILNNALQSQQSNEPWVENSQIPAPSHYEHSFQPRYDVSVSSEVNGDSMPRSAHIMQQSKPLDNDVLASQLNLSAQEQNVKSHLNCHHCNEVLAAGDVAVFADRAGDNTAWHPNCFVCQTCDELLVDLIYFFDKGNVYCGRHFAELLNIPRCYACDELIFVKEYTVAEGKTFHVKHFCCYECDDPLAGKQYVPTDDQPTCLDCYQEIFGKRCHTCRKQIPAAERRVGWKELNWHAVEDCFRCHGCKKSLLGGRFVMNDKQPYCNKDCVNLLPEVCGLGDF